MKILFDGSGERMNIFIGFEGDEIKHVGISKPQEDNAIYILKSAKNGVLYRYYIAYIKNFR